MLYFETRDENLRFMKRLWSGVPTICPKCGKSELVPLHKKAKKSNNDWECPCFGEVYRTINMMYELPDK